MNMKITVCAAFLMMAGTAMAQSETDGTLGFNRQESSADLKILEDIHQTNLAEIKMAGFGAAHATDKDVKAFARRLVRDHKASEKAIGEVARQADVTLTDEVPDMAAETITALEPRNGHDFDMEFLRDMSDDHQQALDTIAADRGPVSHKGVLAFVDKVTVTVQKHKAAADSLLKKLDATAAN